VLSGKRIERAEIGAPGEPASRGNGVTTVHPRPARQKPLHRYDCELHRTITNAFNFNDVVMAWAIDRLGRSLIDLLGTIQALEACGVDLYLDQQSIDTTTPAGRLMFQVTGAFAEFERSMIRQRRHRRIQLPNKGHHNT
jgi:hypothetical protein